MGHAVPRRVLIAATLALAEGGFMILDSVHRLVTGDFLRLAGQLGPWSAIVSAVGIDPMSTGPAFLVLGIVYVIAAVGLLRGYRRGYPLTMGMAVGTLWYLVFGTVSSVAQILLLVRVRGRLQRE